MKPLLVWLSCGAILLAQAPPLQNPPGSQVVTLERTPLYRVTVVQRTARAVNYRHRAGATKVDFRGTTLLPHANGEAKVESKQGYIEIEVEFDDMSPATQFGPEYLTYVLWAITPEGRAQNLGEVILNGDRSKLNVTTELQAFGMVMTAEPYFAVTQPGNVVVMENVIRPDTKGKVEVINAKYELLERGQYTLHVERAALRPLGAGPLHIREARNAVQIARRAGADRYAAESFQKAQSLLRQAELQSAKKDDRSAAMSARESVQQAEDARLIALKRIDAERQEAERRAAAEREDKARREAETAARARAQAEEQQRLEEQRRARAEAERLAAERAKAEAVAARRAAIEEQRRAQAEAERARQAAQESERARLSAEAEKEKIRRQLLEQLNMVLETRDTARGLIVNMSDVLFDFNKWTLKPGAREKLAKIAGIVLSHPGLLLAVEGHTDSVGRDEYNQELSEKRAASVRDYLVGQSVPDTSITARGFGEAHPVAGNDSAAGRQQNRRVELVVSGDIIGTTVTGMRTTVR
ncbi:MAG: OmpA family protein [Acidobacteria bacterium]|nr:OmpA family protein [Acidobacteriota bacterium]